MSNPDYVVKVKTADKLRVIGVGYRQPGNIVKLEMDVLPFQGVVWLYPFEERRY